MRYLSLAEVLELHSRLIQKSGGADGLRDLAALESALAQPRLTFDKTDLYRTLEEKAVALGYSLILNHPFMDGNKRVGHAALETFLVLNGHELDVPVDDAERVILDVAGGTCSREDFLSWLREHVIRRAGE